MAECTTQAKCTDAEWDAAVSVGLLWVTPGTNAFDAALHKYTERMQQVAYAEGRKDEAEEHSAPYLETLRHIHTQLASNCRFDMDGAPETDWDAFAFGLVKFLDRCMNERA